MEVREFRAETFNFIFIPTSLGCDPTHFFPDIFFPEDWETFAFSLPEPKPRFPPHELGRLRVQLTAAEALRRYLLISTGPLACFRRFLPSKGPIKPNNKLKGKTKG